MSDNLEQFLNTIKAIRDPKTGCPWNLAQSHASLKRYLLEEMYETLEVIDAIEEEGQASQETYTNLQEELGDLLLQIVLHARLAEEQGAFSLDDVIKQINHKMITRHPHVFNVAETGSASTTKEVDKHWDKAKAAEKQNRNSIFEGIPKEMPALSRAWKISKKAVKESFEWDEEEKLWAQLESEIAEMMEVIDEYRAFSGLDPYHDGYDNEKVKHEAELELGDVLFTIVNIARWYRLDPEEALRKTNNKFIRRFDVMMQLTKNEGKSLRDYTVVEMEELWNQAKKILLKS